MKSNPQKSLPAKVGRIITGFSFLMVIFYSYMMLLSKDSGLRDATHSILIHESRLFIDAYRKNPNSPLPQSYSLRGFIGKENIPADIAEFFPPHQRASWHQRKSGVYYSYSTNQDYDSHHHMYVQQLPDSTQEFFVYYRLLIYQDDRVDLWKNVKQVSLLGFALVVVLLLILRNFIHRALNPISHLSCWINDLADKQKPAPLPNDIQDDEIGQLAQNLFNALERINSQNEHERSFLRNASHELRTPIAIIRNTMDVMEHKGNTLDSRLNPHLNYQQIVPLMQRIRRASDTMKAVTEAILWLAIDEYAAPDETEVNLVSLLEDVIQQNSNLINDKTMTISTNISGLGVITTQKALAYITIDNLIRNAFQHCSQGNIQVKATSSYRIEISNNRYDTNQPDENDKADKVNTGGFGLGLALVQKIAEKKHWLFTFSLKDNYAVVSLEFS